MASARDQRRHGSTTPRCISETTLFRWIKHFEIDEGAREGATTDEQAELRADKRRLEQENEILRRAAAYLARDALPK